MLSIGRPSLFEDNRRLRAVREAVGEAVGEGGR